jgi:hypothetical protein
MTHSHTLAEVQGWFDENGARVPQRADRPGLGGALRAGSRQLAARGLAGAARLDPHARAGGRPVRYGGPTESL